MRMILVALSLFSGLLATPFMLVRQSEAALGEPAASVAADRKALSAVQRAATPRNGYTVQELVTGGNTVREYITPSGIVFAVAWKGVSHPDLTPLLGSYLTEYKQALQQAPRQRTFNSSFIDSGSNGLFFDDPAIPTCSSPNQAWYCPPSTLSLNATNYGAFGTPSGPVAFTIGNATSLFSTSNSAFAELGGPGFGSGFDWGLPFFYGRTVFVGIEGTSSSLGSGPYWAY